MIGYCEQHRIELTRSRPYRKNDQAWVEQKNGAVVRKLVGYGRLEGLTAAEALGRLYVVSRLFVNFFQPSFKLATKTRVGSRIVKSYHTPETPCARLLASAQIPNAIKMGSASFSKHLILFGCSVKLGQSNITSHYWQKVRLPTFPN